MNSASHYTPKKAIRFASLSSSQLKCKLRIHWRAIIQCMKYCAQHSLSTILSAFLLGLMITLPLIFLMLLSDHPNNIRQYIQTTPSISVYLQPGLATNEQQTIEQSLQALNNVARVKMVSPEQGMKQLEQAMSIDSLSNILPATTLPSVLVIEPKQSTPEALQRLSQQLQTIKGIASTQTDWLWVKRVYQFLQLSHRIGLLIAITFSLISLFFIANMIRLSLIKEAPKNDVLQLLGAPPSFIRRTGLYRGATYGALAGALTNILIMLIGHWLNGPLQALAISYDQQTTIGLHLSTTQSLLLFTITTCLGYFGALMAQISTR